MQESFLRKHMKRVQLKMFSRPLGETWVETTMMRQGSRAPSLLPATQACGLDLLYKDSISQK